MRRIAGALLAALIAAAGPVCAAAPARAPKHAVHHAPKSIVITGSVIAINGDLVQFRLDKGKTVTVDQHSLVTAGQPLTLGGHFALRGNYRDNLFVARPGGGNDAENGNGYPYPGSTANVQGIIASIDANRVTIMQGLFSTITIDDQQAIDNGTAQNLWVGRSITAYGYWSGSTFYATSIG